MGLIVRASVAAALAVTPVGAAPIAAVSQDSGAVPPFSVDGGSLDATVAGADARVRLVWRAAEPVPSTNLSGLLWPGQAVTDFERMGSSPGALIREDVGPLAFEREGPALLRWRVDAATRDSLVLVYTVRGALSREGGLARLRIPVMVPAGDPPPTRPDLFRARVELPAGVSVRGGFPSGLEAGVEDGSPVVQASLAVLPRSIDLDLVEGSLGPLGRTTPLEAVALVLILVAGLWGWRRLQDTG